MEIWKDIEGFDTYQVSNLGRVKRLAVTSSVGHSLKELIMKSRLGGNGYMKIGLLNKEGKQITNLVHRLVAQAFIPNPENKREVNHKDLDKTNNYIYNLEWVTPWENIDWNRQNNKILRGEQMGCSIFTNKQVMAFRKLLKNNPKMNVSKYARENGLNRSTLSNIKTKKTWKHLIKGDENGKK